MIDTLTDNRKLIRPPDVPHLDFVFAQKAEWGAIHRVILGKWTSNYQKLKEIEWWCNDNIYGRWFHSEANEVYYFEESNSAILFKLRWFSELTT